MQLIQTSDNIVAYKVKRIAVALCGLRFEHYDSTSIGFTQGIFQDLEHGGVNQPLGVPSLLLSPFLSPSLPFLSFPLKPGGVVRKLGGINPPQGVWETPWVFFRIWNMGGVNQPLGVPSLLLSPSLSPSLPFFSFPPFPLKPGGCCAKVGGGGINPPQGVWETPWVYSARHEAYAPLIGFWNYLTYNADGLKMVLYGMVWYGIFIALSCGRARREPICPFVRQSHADSVSKQTTVGSSLFYCRIAQGLYFWDLLSYPRSQGYAYTVSESFKREYRVGENGKNP